MRLSGGVHLIDQTKNISINAKLSALYERYADSYLSAYVEVFQDNNPPCRINEFGIIDEERYDCENGILILAKETDGWSNEDYHNGVLFRGWLNDITHNGLHDHAKRHPIMWYNIARWISFIIDPEQQIDELANLYPITEIGKVAYTNMNKVRGDTQSGAQYWRLANMDISGEILREEITILQPKYILCCGTYHEFIHHIPHYDGVVVDMPHPGARKSKLDMLKTLSMQLPLRMSRRQNKNDA